MTTQNRLPHPPPDVYSEMRQEVVDYWNAIETLKDPDGILRSLDPEAQSRVKELLATGDLSDIYEAHRITAAFECRRLECL